MNTPKFLIVHHEAPPMVITGDRFNIVNEYHKQKWDFKSSLGFYCGYQYFVELSGKVIQARADNEEGAHTIGKNTESIGICLANNFDLTLPTQAQIDALTKLLKEKMIQHNILVENIVPHRKFANKSCYGKNLPDDWAANLVRETLPTEQLTTEEISRVRKLLKTFFWIK